MKTEQDFDIDQFFADNSWCMLTCPRLRYPIQFTDTKSIVVLGDEHKRIGPNRWRYVTPQYQVFDISLKDGFFYSGYYAFKLRRFHEKDLINLALRAELSESGIEWALGAFLGSTSPQIPSGCLWHISCFWTRYHKTYDSITSLLTDIWAVSEMLPVLDNLSEDQTYYLLADQLL